MPRTLFIGDVHGCLEELDELVYALALGQADRLFFLGDLVDRGPDSVGVIRRVRELLVRYPGSACIAGNHEEKNLRYREKGREGPAWWTKADDDDWAFLDSLPLFHRLPGTLLVHGGLYQAFFDAYGTLDDPPANWRSDRGKRAERAARFLRVRQVSPEGQMVPFGDVVPGAVHWTSRYDGREGFCFFGHDPQIEPPDVLRAEHAMGLDTGCCFGGRLTAAVISEGVAPSAAAIVSVTARSQYATPRQLHGD